MTDEQITQAALDAARTGFGDAPAPSFVQLFHYRRGLSIAGPGRYATMNTVHRQLLHGIHLAGDYFAHAGVEAAIFSGELAANRQCATPPRPSTPAPRPAQLVAT